MLRGVRKVSVLYGMYMVFKILNTRGRIKEVKVIP